MKDQIKSVPDVSISHYQRLGVAPGVDPEALRQAFRRKSKALHPDTTALPEAQASLAFQQLKESYALLADPGRRDAYDAMLRETTARPPVVQKSISDPWNGIGERRPLSGGEWFSLVLLSLALLLSLLLGLGVAVVQGRDWQVSPSWLTDEQTLRTSNLRSDAVPPPTGEFTTQSALPPSA